MAANKDKLIAAAQKLVEKGQLDKAIKEYLKVVQSDDKDVRIWLKIGDLYAKLGKRPEATETYQKVAEFYSDQGFYLKSVAVYKQILKIEPRLVDINQRLADLYKQLGLLSDAMQQFETVAAFFHKEGKTREALAALKQIVELDPETVANRIKLAELYSKEGMAREAIDEFTRAAEQLKEAGRIDDYMKVAERLLFHSPDNRPVSRELARLYIDKGDPRRALPKLQICFKADPRDTDVLNLLARAFEALEQRQKAVSVLKELARILGENGDRQARDEVYRRILVLQPGDADAESALGVGNRPPTNPGIVEPPAPPPPVVQPRASFVSSQHNTLGMTGSQPLMSASFPQPHAEEPPPPDEFDEASTRAAGRAPAIPTVTRSTSVPPFADDEKPHQGEGGEEVARILNETDVYIKYKLYAKAIEHVQRVFEHDPSHVEAREKLKALYMTVGKNDEAVLELWALAEQAEPGRKRRYLREILEIDPGNARAAQQLGEAPSVAQAVPAAPPPKLGSRAPDDDDAMDVEELPELGADEFEEADPSVARFKSPYANADSDEMRVEDAEEQADADDDLIPLVVDSGVDRQAAREDAAVEDRFGFDADEDSTTGKPDVQDRFGFDDESEPPPEERSMEAMEPSDSEVNAIKAPPRRFEPEERSEDHDVRTRFDPAAVNKMLAQDALASQEVDDDDLPPAPPAGKKGTTATVPAAQLRTQPGTAPPDVSIEDDLDEADFFVQQSLFEEARQILEGLLSRYPGHPLVSAKLRDLDAAEHAQAPREEPAMEPAHESAHLSAELPSDLPGAGQAGASDAESADGVYELTRKGVIEKGVSAEDFETHYDLGIAYKEMGLLDDAIVEFKMVMKDPTREVQCHLMIGLCCLEKGLQTEAIGHFKKGLYVEGITERESLNLYFELGQAYERLGDPREALYYYEKVLKRDPSFRNIEAVVEQLRKGGPSEPEKPEKPAGPRDDVDVAFDTLLGSE